jgi:hypothetical protein
MKKIIAFLLVSIFLISLPTSCKKDKGTPPALPPSTTMKIDFDNFSSGKKSIDLLSSKGTENSNFEFAAGCAGFFNLVLFSTLIVPVTAYEVAIDQTPVSIGGNTWQWSYTVTVLTVSYKARLTGQIRSTDVLWQMYITKEGGTSPFAEFMWFSGTSKLDGTGGQWILNLSSANQVPVIQIDWTGTGFEADEIKYTFVQTGNDYYGSYIEYGTTTGTLDGYYNIHLWDGAADFVDVFIEWSTTGHNGRVKCFEEFGDNDWHAWDSNYVNI